MVTDVQSSSISRLGIGFFWTWRSRGYVPGEVLRFGSIPTAWQLFTVWDDDSTVSIPEQLGVFVRVLLEREVLSVGLSRSCAIVTTTTSLAGGFWTRNGFWTLRPSCAIAIWGVIPEFVFTRNNTRLPKFVSPILVLHRGSDHFQSGWIRWEKFYLFSS